MRVLAIFGARLNFEGVQDQKKLKN